ncbi:MAG: AAA family ATPase [Jannaschia sp.]
MMMIVLNGRPGAGKLTVGRLLAERTGARLLDAHTLYNLAFALTDKGSKAFEDCVWKLRGIARDSVLALPANTPVVLTDAVFDDSAWGNVIWDDTIALARDRGGPFVVVILDCDPAENERRLGSPERMGKRKPMDGSVLSPNRYERRPICRGADALLELDTTDLSADETAERIETWLREGHLMPLL